MQDAVYIYIANCSSGKSSNGTCLSFRGTLHWLDPDPISSKPLGQKETDMSSIILIGLGQILLGLAISTIQLLRLQLVIAFRKQPNDSIVFFLQGIFWLDCTRSAMLVMLQSKPFPIISQLSDFTINMGQLSLWVTIPNCEGYELCTWSKKSCYYKAHCLGNYAAFCQKFWELCSDCIKVRRTQNVYKVNESGVGITIFCKLCGA